MGSLQLDLDYGVISVICPLTNLFLRICKSGPDAFIPIFPIVFVGPKITLCRSAPFLPSSPR